MAFCETMIVDQSHNPHMFEFPGMADLTPFLSSESGANIAIPALGESRRSPNSTIFSQTYNESLMQFSSNKFIRRQE